MYIVERMPMGGDEHCVNVPHGEDGSAVCVGELVDCTHCCSGMALVVGNAECCGLHV